MFAELHHQCMRTTIDIEKPVLEKLKRIQKAEKRSLGQIASSLLAQALKEDEAQRKTAREPSLEWITARMDARVDLSDKDAIYRALDGQ